MSEDETIDELIFPETLEETRQSISVLIGDVTESREWVKLQYAGRADGLWVDYNGIRERNIEIAEMQGDIAALKKHAASMRGGKNEELALAKAERNRLKLETAKLQKERERQAQEAKRDTAVKVARSHQLAAEAALEAVMVYIKDNVPDHWAMVQIVRNSARDTAKRLGNAA